LILLLLKNAHLLLLKNARKKTQIMMATVRHINACAGRMKYQAAWFLLNRVHTATLQNEEMFHHINVSNLS